MLTASCHCGAVSLEIDEKPESLTECTCSICHRLAAQWAYYTRLQVRVIDPQGLSTAYLWGDKCIEFYHCGVCGCTTHYESVDKGPDSRIAVNTKTMRPQDVAGIRVRKFDGASTWKFLDE